MYHSMMSYFYLTHPTCICSAQQPQISISSPSSVVPMAGEDYSLRCGVTILKELSAMQIYWINPSGIYSTKSKLYKSTLHK